MGLCTGRLDTHLPPGRRGQGVGCAGPGSPATDRAHADGGAKDGDQDSTTAQANAPTLDYHRNALGIADFPTTADGDVGPDCAWACGQPVRPDHHIAGTDEGKAHTGSEMPTPGENDFSCERWQTGSAGYVPCADTSPGGSCDRRHPSAPDSPAVNGCPTLRALAADAKRGLHPGSLLGGGTSSPRLHLRQTLHSNYPLQSNGCGSWKPQSR